MQPTQHFSLLTRLPTVTITAPSSALLPVSNTLAAQPNAGYKVKVRLRKRCQHCFYVRRRGRWFIECKEKGRHKQMQ
uniref:Large ribosomal subunit protein bL36m n=1 Tax=Capitella teleta TaxID=283909 RepID=X2B7Y9_CAPTE